MAPPRPTRGLSLKRAQLWDFKLKIIKHLLRDQCVKSDFTGTGTRHLMHYALPLLRARMSSSVVIVR